MPIAMISRKPGNNNNNNNNSIYLNTIKNLAKADVVVYGQ